MGSAEDLQLAFELSDRAARMAQAHFESGVTATLKPDGSPVTDADREVEQLLRELVAQARPDDAILGEEFGRTGDSSRVWILDPIDGTDLFSAGDPNWRVQVALEVDGSIELGVVTEPALGRCWWATRGGEAFEASWPRSDDGGRRLSVSRTADVDGAVISALDDEAWNRLPDNAIRGPLGPLPLIELVRGEIDAFLVERYYAWDHAPWILLVEEAGGRFTDRAGGHSSHAGGGLYSNAYLHQPLLTWLGYPRSESD